MLSDLFEIHIVSSESSVGVSTDFAGLMGCSATSSSSTGLFAVQTYLLNSESGGVCANSTAKSTARGRLFRCRTGTGNVSGTDTSRGHHWYGLGTYIYAVPVSIIFKFFRFPSPYPSRLFWFINRRIAKNIIFLIPLLNYTLTKFRAKFLIGKIALYPSFH
ncbi:unnamed protein product [Brassica oleracea var. botrytis]|uniref:(rape) hypothetical protein n=1 Tax=Brassica napus TaxID=3708 RepID=A0A816TZP7_BRANA|nr:unnamed protein product [Brassica napus]